MGDLIYPDIAGQFNQGFDRGQQMQFTRLAGQAIQNPDQRSALLGQAASINPGGALQIQGMYDQQAQQQQAQQQAQQADVAKKLGGAARYMKAALDTGDQSQIQGAWQAVRPFLEQTTGKQTPEQFDPAMAPLIYQVIAQTSSVFPDDNKIYNLAPGGRLVNSGGKTIANAPFKPANMQVSNGYAFNPNTGQASPIPIGAPNAQPSAPPQSGNTTMTGADGTTVKFDFAPGTPQAVIDEAYSQARASGDVPAPAQGQPTTLADAIAQQKAAQKAASASADAEGLTQDARDMLAAAGAQGYKIPMPAFGMRNSGMRADYLNDIASKAKPANGDWLSAVHNMIYGETGLGGAKQTQKTFASTAMNESAALSQADIVSSVAAKVDRTGIPIFNKWIQAGRAATGDPSVTNLNNAVNTFAEEFAKVMTGQTSGAATDSARQLAHTYINSAMSPDQLAGAINLMKMEMQKRTQAQGSAINQQISGLSNSGGFAQPQAQSPQGWSIQKIP